MVFYFTRRIEYSRCSVRSKRRSPAIAGVASAIAESPENYLRYAANRRKT
jgi:hypothetical protein